VESERSKTELKKPLVAVSKPLPNFYQHLSEKSTDIGFMAA